VTEQDLNDADVDAALEEVGGETMPQNMHADQLVELRRGRRRTAGGCSTVGSIGLSGLRPGNRDKGGRASRQSLRKTPSSGAESIA
jgi:hypothetical protein